MEKNNGNINTFMRKWHGNVGYFLAGLILIYSLSGLVLIYRDTDFLKETVTYEKQLIPNLTAETLDSSLKLKGFKVENITPDRIEFKDGWYNINTGEVSYTKLEMPVWIEKLTSLHKSDSKKTAHYFTTAFGFLMIFLVLSSFWMYRADTKVFKKAMYLVLAGVLFTVFLLML